MKKIKTKSSEVKKQKRNQMIIGMILIFVMFGSVFGIIVNSFGQEGEVRNVNYNGVEFVEQNGFWFASKDNFNLAFRHNPNQIEEIDSELKELNNYYDKPLYIYSEDANSEIEIYRNLFYQNKIVQRMQSACLDKSEDIFNVTSECDENFPTKDCDSNFIIIKENDNSEIIQNKSCVFIYGKNFTEITDEFLFNLFEIRV